MVTVNQAWDPKLFDEADLKTMSNKPFGTLRNLLSFWELHAGGARAVWSDAHVLDSWLRARAHQTYNTVTDHLDAYELTDAARAIGEFVDDLSTWWLRRSRERLKDGDASARATFTAALQLLAVLLAPCAPFHAEHVWRTLHTRGRTSGVDDRKTPDVEERERSVHLASWDAHQPPANDSDATLLQQMAEVRRFCSLGLEARAKAGVPVRQPLHAVHLYTSTPLHLNGALLDLIREELNVKSVTEATGEGIPRVVLDTTLTPELQREGMVRELTRAVNNLRKEMGLTPSDRIRVTYHTDDTDLAAAIDEHRSAIERAVGAVYFSPPPLEGEREGEVGSAHELRIGNTTLTLAITKKA
ncbi:class I tRNA ligase family protein [Candidatus Uhrbacteria bacterium]|nr:class I tRNA ligase family protein [Candidatus Uhrbacteria bacterium]